jgi:hypothetical protein
MIQRMLCRLGWLGLGSCLVFSGCGGSTETGGPAVQGDSGPEDAARAPDSACLAFCASKNLWCLGVDTESGTGVITATTAKGCSVKVTLVVSGTTDATVDCAARNVCVDQGPGGCMGVAGMCYQADLTATGFSYGLPNCIQGSLACYVSD